MSYTRPAHGDRANDGSATDATVIIDALADGLEALEYGVANVRKYGAAGDGSTNDTTAIDAAISAIPSTGGVLYFPPGDYLTSGGHSWSKPVSVVGCGMGTRLNSAKAVTRIKCASATATVFTSTGEGSSFRNFALLNTRLVESTMVVSGSLPTGGAGISVGSGTQSAGDCVMFDRLYVAGFYNNVVIDNSTEWQMRGCSLWAPVHYNVLAKNTSLPDFGDAAVSDTWFIPLRSYANPGSNFRWESGGGLKITNCKFNSGAISAPYTFTGTHLDLAVGSGVNTSDLLVSNSSFEGSESYCISLVQTGSGSFDYIVINGNQFAPYYSGANGVRITGTSGDHIVGVSMVGNVMHGEGGAGTAVALTYVDGAKLANTYSTWATNETTTSCTGVTTL